MRTKLDRVALENDLVERRRLLTGRYEAGDQGAYPGEPASLQIALGAKRTMTKVTFYLPQTDNNGRNLCGDIAETMDEVYAQFGGYTDFGEIEGKFRMANGKSSRDRLYAFSVCFWDNCNHFREDHLIAILNGFKARTLQESIYVEVQRDVDIRFI